MIPERREIAISPELLDCYVKQMAKGLGINIEDKDSSQLRISLEDLAFQRRAEQLGASPEIVQDPHQSFEFLFRLALETPSDKTIVPSLSGMDGVLKFLGQTEVERHKLTDFPFFNRANKNRRELRNRAGKLLRIGLFQKQLTDEFQIVHDWLFESVKLDDSRGLKREEQFLPEDSVNTVRDLLVQIYVAGAKKFSMHLIAPDWYWPITWSGDPTFSDAKEIDRILQDWQREDKRSTVWSAFVDYSKMFSMWFDGRRQLIGFIKNPAIRVLTTTILSR